MAKRKPKEQPCDDIKTYAVTWQGMELKISFERNWLGSPPSEYHPTHLQIETVNPARGPLPITETGYLSHFIAVERIDEEGGPVAYVLAWLDDAAKSKGWKAHVEATRQLSLF